MAIGSAGKVTVTSAGTPVRATINESTPTARLGVQSFTVFAPSGNTGTNIYVGSSAMNKTTYVGVYAIIAKGGSASFSIINAPAGLNLNEIFIDADTSADVALVSYVVQ